MIRLETFKIYLISVAVLSALITYIIFGADNNNDQAKIIALEYKIQELEELIFQKNEESINPSFNGVKPTTQKKSSILHTNNNADESLGNELSESSVVKVPSGELLTELDQLHKDLLTQSERDSRAFHEKINDLLVENPNQENIAIASKSVFDLADNPEILSDYDLEALYVNQSNLDVRRVAAQVLSARGDNRLIEKQISELQPGLQSADAEVRQKTLIELGKTRHVNAANAAVALLGDQSSAVKLEALLTLRATGNQSHVSLVRGLLSDPDTSVSWLANDVVNTLQNLSDVARTRLSADDINAELPPIM
jgi:HEAT repeat protein